MTREDSLKVAKPILFNTDMVRAILDDRKTVTRRCVKQNVEPILNSPYHKEHPEVSDKQIISKLCMPPYQPGDILYVRETWCYIKDIPHWKEYYRIGKSITPDEPVYKADNIKSAGILPVIKWHPSIHMPKEAARIFIKVKDVRVERLQDITEEQAKAEGIREYSKDGKLWKYAVTDDWWIEYHNKHRKEFSGSWWQDMHRTAKEAFSYLWNSTIKKKDLDKYGWDANPWVWVIEFERMKME